jgi:hypothetical protein
MRKLVGAIASVLVLAFAGFSLTATDAVAGETHFNCVTFDSNGNIISVVPNCSETQTVKNQTFAMPSANPCSGVHGILTEDFRNEIFHVTVNGAGDVWLTQTQTGSISFVPFNASQPSYSGHIASWFGGSLNKNNSVIHDTSNARLRGSDGSTVALHMVDHTSFSASGIVNTFSIGGFTCG